MDKRQPLIKGHTMLFREGVFPLSCDTVFLSDFVRARPGDRILDMGAGCGALSLLLLIRNQGIVVDGVELDAPAASLAQRNMEENGFSGRGRIWQGDYRDLPEQCLRLYDVCVSNPPYYEEGTGKMPACRSRAQSRGGGEDSLGELCRSAGRSLKTHGTLFLCYPAAKLERLMDVLRDCRFAVKRLRFVHHSPEKEAFLALLEARHDGGCGCRVCPPLFLKTDGQDTPECRRIYSGQEYWYDFL